MPTLFKELTEGLLTESQAVAGMRMEGTLDLTLRTPFDWVSDKGNFYYGETKFTCNIKAYCLPNYTLAN